MKKINRKTIIEDIVKETGICFKDVSKILSSYECFLKKYLAKGKTITFTHFGSFSLKKHKGHVAKYGNTKLKDYNVLKFKPSGSFMDGLR